MFKVSFIALVAGILGNLFLCHAFRLTDSGLIEADQALLIESSNRCSSKKDSGELNIENLFSEYAVNTLGASCPGPIPSPDDDSIEDEDELKKIMAESTCPAWENNGKQCILDHITTKCNYEEQEELRRSLEFALKISYFALLCQDKASLEADSLDNFISEVSNIGLYKCITDDESSEFEDDAEQCMSKAKEENSGSNSALVQVKSIGQCLRPTIQRCAQDDAAKETKMLKMWNTLENIATRAIIQFWNPELLE